MAPPPLLQQHVHISRADFLYKTGDETLWTRLPSPIGDKRHNCYGIKFDGGMIRTQRDHKYGSVCHVKLVLDSFDMLYEDGLPIIEAVCVEVRNPRFTARPDCRDKAKALEHAKSLPLGSLDKTITAVKVRNLSDKGFYGAKHIYDDKLRDRILESVDCGYRAAQNSGSARELWTAPPQLSNSSSEIPTDRSGLREQLQTHQATTPQLSSSSLENSIDKGEPKVQLSAYPTTTAS